MDSAHLTEALTHTFNQDATIRKQAEDFLNDSTRKPGFLVAVLKVAVDQSSANEVISMAACVYLKNGVMKNWNKNLYASLVRASNGTPPPGRYEISDEDRHVLRNNILDALVLAPNQQLRKMLSESVGAIAAEDFPDRWPTLLPKLVEQLQSGDVNQVSAGLLALHRVLKQYERCSPEVRGKPDSLIQATFPILRSLLQSFLHHNSPEAVIMMKSICKTFFAATQVYLSPTLQNIEVIAEWFRYFEFLMAKEIPPASSGQEPRGEPENEDERVKWPWWKIKVWVGRIACRFYERFGLEAFAEEPLQPLARQFSERGIATRMLGACMQVLGWRHEGRYCPDLVIQYCIGFVNLGTTTAATFKQIQPHIEVLLRNVVFPLMCFNQRDAELWEENPEEFARQSCSVINESLDVRGAASEMLVEVCKKRSKRMVPLVMKLLEDVLVQYVSAAPDAKKYPEKDGVLAVLRVLAPVFTAKKGLRKLLENMVVQHVVPEMQSSHAFLRAQACRTFREYVSIPWSQPENAQQSLQKMLVLLRDQDLPVRVQAAAALSFALEEGGEVMIHAVRSSIADIIRAVLVIMSEVGVDEVVSTLHSLIDCFGEELEPEAIVDICAGMAQSFMQYATAEDDEEELLAMAAANCMDAINSLMVVSCKNQQLVTRMVPILLPVLKHVINPESESLLDFLDSALGVLANVVYSLDEISPELMDMIPSMHAMFCGQCFDYLQEFSVPLENMIEKHPAAFVRGNPAKGFNYAELVFDMVKTIFEMEDTNVNELSMAANLLSTMLISCRGMIDSAVPAIVKLALERLARPAIRAPAPNTRQAKTFSKEADRSTTLVHLAISAVLESALYYNPKIALESIGEANLANAFELLVQMLPEHKKEHDRKLAVLAISSLFSFPITSLPPVLQHALGTILDKTVQTMTELATTRQQAAEREQLQKQQGDDDDEDDDYEDDDEDEGPGDDEDAYDQEEIQYLEYLRKMRDSNFDDFNFDDEDYEDGDYISPLDNVDEVVEFARALKSQIQDPSFKQLIDSRSPELQNTIKEIMQSAEQKEHALASQQ